MPSNSLETLDIHYNINYTYIIYNNIFLKGKTNMYNIILFNHVCYYTHNHETGIHTTIESHWYSKLSIRW